MLFTIESIVNLRRPNVKLVSDGWTTVTRDSSLSAQFERSAAFSETGVQVFTLLSARLHHPPYH